MPDAQSKVTIVFEGKAQNLEAALKEVQADLARFGAQADKAGAQAGEHLAAGEHRAAHEAAGLGERAKVAAEMVGLLGAESAEQVIKVQGLSHAFGEARHAFGGFGGAIAATAGSFALFKGLDFLHESVDAAMEGEHATAAFNAAFAKTPALMAAATKSIEEHREQLTQLGIDDSDVMALMARAGGRGLDPRLITENTEAFADLGVAIGSDFGGAVDAVTHGQRGLSQVMRALNLSAAQQKQLMKELSTATPEERVRAILGLVEGSKFAGAAAAQAGTSEGKFKAFQTAMHNLQEEVGTALLPALTDLADAMTALLGAAEHAAQPFGGLANVLKTLFVPMLGLGLFLFTNLRGVMTRLVDVLLGRLLGAFSQTATSMAEADASARNLADDINKIPETALTTAKFLPDPAKELWIANVKSVPPEALTTAKFVPATIPATATTPVKVPVVYEGTLKEATPHPLSVPVRYVTRGLGTGLALGSALAITDAIFHSVTIKHVTMPAQKIPAGTPHAGPTTTVSTAPATTVSIRGVPHVAISGTPHVAVTNLGSLGPALAGGHPVAPGHPVTVPSTVTLPKTMDVKAHQSGRWEVSLAPDAFARFGQMVAEITLGVVIANAVSALGKWGFDKLKDLLPKLVGRVRGRGGGKGGPGGGGTPEEPLDIPGVLKEVEELFKSARPNAQPQGAHSTFIVTGLANAFKAIDWKGVLSAAGFAAKIAGAIGGFFLAAFGLLGKALSATGGPQAAAISAGPLAAKLALLGAQIVEAIAKGITGALGTIGSIGAAIMAALLHAVMAHWPSALPWPFGGERPKHGALYIGEHNYPEYVKAGSKVPSAPHGYEYVPTHNAAYPYRLEQTTKHGAKPIPSDFIGRFGGIGGGLGLAALVPQLREIVVGSTAATHPSHQIAARVAALHPGQAAHHAAAAHPAHGAGAQQTNQHTYHATFNIHGATDPHAVARQVNHAFSEFVQGARATKRLHG